MYEIDVQAEFSAAHAIRIAGIVEPLHGHNWHVTATVVGPELDADGLLCDFHTIEQSLRQITARFHNRNLNDCPPFRPADRDPGINPTAELVARQIARELSAAIDLSLAPHARLVRVRVTEAPGCAATYHTPNQPQQ